MKNNFTATTLIALIGILLISCNSISKKECMDKNSDQYKFGVEMATWSKLRGGIGLERSISEFKEQFDVNNFTADDPCVKKGYEDEMK
jgi:hypothetical protein